MQKCGRDNPFFISDSVGSSPVEEQIAGRVDVEEDHQQVPENCKSEKYDQNDNRDTGSAVKAENFFPEVEGDGPHLAVEKNGKEKENQRIRLERQERVQGQESMECARHPACGAIEMPDIVQGADAEQSSECGVLYDRAVEEKRRHCQ